MALARLRDDVGCRDEGLARHAVGEDGGASDTVALDEHDLCTELPGNEGRLVAGRSTADHHH